MHNRKEPDYQDFFPDFLEDLRKCIRSAKAAGISDDRIMLDPGVGFGKTYDMNLAVIRNLDRMQDWIPGAAWNIPEIRDRPDS